MATDKTKVEFKLKFKFQHETKGAVRYGEVLPSGSISIAPNDSGAVIGTLYFRKTAFGNNSFPDNIEITALGD